MGKRAWRRVDGVLLLDKANGMTSNAALQVARRLFSAAKAGHTGTLDPLATGLLPLCFGEATKFSADLLSADKCYEADLLFGVTTDSGDADGSVVEQRPVNFSRSDLERLLEGFRGPITQIPPMYSALKHAGRPLYELARQGVEIEREARSVTIHELVLLDVGDSTCRLRVACSKGTYIRSLAMDIGEALGSGAHLTALRRTVVGPLVIGDAVSLDRLSEMTDEERAASLLPPDALLQSLPKVGLDPAASIRFGHGNPVSIAGEFGGRAGLRRVYGEGRFLGLGEVDETGNVKPRRLVCA